MHLSGGLGIYVSSYTDVGCLLSKYLPSKIPFILFSSHEKKKDFFASSS